MQRIGLSLDYALDRYNMDEKQYRNPRIIHLLHSLRLHDKQDEKA